jgi:ABC-type branched-subunit amino acid transport system ATPase component
MLEATDVRKHFGGVTALEKVSVRVSPGEVVGMVGPNGSGKSTFLEILCGRIRPDGGTVAVDGRSLRSGVHNGFNGPPVFRTHQRARVFPWHSVAENIHLGQWGVPAGSASSSWPLPAFQAPQARLAADLSLGEKRSLNLSWLWERINSVRYFLLDEPCAGGDEAFVRDLIQFVTAARASGKGILWVEHNPQMLAEHADRVVTLVAGRSRDVAPAVSDRTDGAREKRGGYRTESGLVGAGLTVSRNNTAILKNVSIQVRTGEVVGLLGPNGVGKTTLLLALYGHPECRVLNGAVEDGGVTLSGGNIADRVRRGIHLLPQEDGVFKSLTVGEFLDASVEVACQPELADSRINAIVETLPHLRRILNRRCGVLSGGERRIAGIARIMALAPRFALLDEPSAGLDREAREAIGGVIRNLAAAGTGILVAEQDREFAGGIADELIELERSRTT